ncbi:MAG TPA: hypothetical protein VGC67_05070 [Cellulomonas sp.]
MATSRRTRRPSTVTVGALVPAGALALVLTLSGCSATNPIQTAQEYSASDGVGAELGDITAENLLVVAGGADEPGALQGALTNRGSDAVTVTVATTDDSSTEIRVPAGETVLLGGTQGTDVVLTTPDAPGAVTALTLSSGPGGSRSVEIPVLDGTLPEYADLVPSA